MDMRFGTWNVGSLYRAGLLKTVASELGKYNLYLVAVQEVRLDKGGNEPIHDYTFFSGTGNANQYLGTDFFMHKEIRSAVKRIEFNSDGMLYVILKEFDVMLF